MVGAGIGSRGSLLWDKLSQRYEKCPHDIKSCGHMKCYFLRGKNLFRIHTQNNPVDGFHFFSIAEKDEAIKAQEHSRHSDTSLDTAVSSVHSPIPHPILCSARKTAV